MRGFKSLVSQPGGWDAASAGVLTASSITVLDAARLSVEVPQMAGFDILSAQQIKLTVPPVAVLSNHGFDSNNTIRILPSAGRAALSGSLLQSLTEAALRGNSGNSSSMELTISLIFRRVRRHPCQRLVSGHRLRPGDSGDKHVTAQKHSAWATRFLSVNSH